MIGRLWRFLPFRLATVTGVGSLLVLVGAVVDQWRVAAAGLALSILGAAASSLLLARGLHRTHHAALSLGASDYGVTGEVADELVVVKTLRTVLADELAVARDGARPAAAFPDAEVAAAIRLVTRYDTQPPVPMPAALPPTRVHALVSAIGSLAPRRVLAVGTGVDTLWAMRTLQQVGATLDLVCDVREGGPLTRLVSERGGQEILRVRPVERAVPSAPHAVHPWYALPETGDPYDLVVVAAATPAEARAAVPALPIVLQRLAPDGRVVAIEGAAHGPLGAGWSASDLVTVDTHHADHEPRVVLEPRREPRADEVRAR